ncbi:MAG: selenocysteine-specific translation elongation factor, partial [Pseudomonadota bacterium]|nr:selenocysteine-specific translation elongation factor [Pseudomonadota bacterium]
EKKRGITIELGFAHLDLPDGQSLGIIDVPGHERFIKNMVAGVAGIDLVALVIAADEGVMPQTREHLDICRLLGVRQGLVIMTKMDMVDDEWRELVMDDIRKYLHGTFLEELPIMPVSAVTGEGIEDLLQELMRLAAETAARPLAGPFRLPIDRAFVMKGFGSVVTGTTLSGSVNVGDQVELLPVGLASRVRGIQTYDSIRETAAAGERTAVNLQGLEKSQIVRGEILVHPGTVQTTSMIDMYYSHLPGASNPLKPRSKMMVHAGSAAIMATVVVLSGEGINPGESDYVQIRLDSPTVVMYGDRLVLRSFAWQETMGGGQVLDPHPRKHRLKEFPGLLPSLEILRQGDILPVIEVLIDNHGLQGLNAREIAGMVSLSNKRLRQVLDELSATGKVVRYDVERRAYISGKRFRELQDKLLELVAAYHQQFPVKLGIFKEELKSRLQLKSLLFANVLQRTIKDQRLVLEKDIIRFPDHQIRLEADEKALKGNVLRIYRQAGLQFPDFRDLISELKVTEAEVRTMVRLLEKEGELIRVREGIYIPSGDYEQLKKKVISYLESHGELTTLKFKEMVGLTRKYIIPLIECLDMYKVTQRQGDIRVLLK